MKKELAMPDSQNEPIQTEKTQPAADHQSEARKDGMNIDRCFHAWLADRIASLDRKRTTAWQKVRSFLFGKWVF
jgi:hypothetical protein